MNNKNTKLSFSTFLSIMTLLLAIIATIPSFLSLEKPVNKLYYSENYSEIIIPKQIDTEEIRSFMISNGIPRVNWELNFINQGNSNCKELKVEIVTLDKFMNLTFEPDTSNHPIWISFEQVEILNDSTRIIANIGNFATSKIATIRLGFDKKIKRNIKSQILYNGIYAEPTQNLASIKRWSKFEVFKLPLYILAFGLFAALCISTVSFIIRNDNFRKSLYSAIIDVSQEVFLSYGVMGRMIVESLEKRKAK